MIADVLALDDAVAAAMRITARVIERLDELDGDANAEPERDCCAAGNDDVRGGSSPGLAQYDQRTAGDALEEDEDDFHELRRRYVQARRTTRLHRSAA